jgi:hypothetical protein
MWLKTVLHGLERWVPTSAEYRQEMAAATAAAVSPATGFPDAVTRRDVRNPAGDTAPDPEADIHDAVIVDEAPSQPDSGAADEPWPETAQPGGGRPS